MKSRNYFKKGRGMPKKPPKHELEKLVQIIAGYPQGISVEELLGVLMGATPKRTLQYRLASLVKAGVLRNEGLGRGSRYYLAKGVESQAASEKKEVPSRSFVIPISSESQEIRELISAPIQMRRHVSYHKEFLDAYEPNKTCYLTKSNLEKLSKLNAGIEKGRPAGTYARKIYQRLLIDLSWNSTLLEGNT
jgi:hypothetical protein